MFDIRDITELLPFIRDNLSNSIYIMAFSFFVGFSVGKLVSGLKTKSKKKLEKENRRLQCELDAHNKEQSAQTLILPVADVEKLSSSGFEVEYNALIEMRIKKTFDKAD